MDDRLNHAMSYELHIQHVKQLPLSIYDNHL